MMLPALLIAAISLGGCAAAIVQARQAEDAQVKPQITSGLRSLREGCLAELQAPALTPLRGKVAMDFAGGVPFQLLVVDSRPDAAEQQAIVAWAEIRKRCYDRIRTFLARLPLPESMDADLKERARAGLVTFADGQLQTGNFLSAALYSGQMTYGEFNRHRSEYYTTSLAALKIWLSALDAQDRAQIMQRVAEAQQQVQAAAILLKAVGCVAGARSQFVQAMCQ